MLRCVWVRLGVKSARSERYKPTGNATILPARPTRAVRHFSCCVRLLFSDVLLDIAMDVTC